MILASVALALVVGSAFAILLLTRLNEITVPTTVIHGDKDVTVPVARAYDMARAIPGATVHVIAGEGHFANVQVTDPDILGRSRRRIRRFATHTRSAGDAC